MKKKYLVLFIGLVLASCGDNSATIDDDVVNDEENIEEEKERPIIELDATEVIIANNQTKFACNFFKEMLANNKNSNFIISPLSAYMDLSMIANGASGKTASEIISVLIGENATIDEVNKFNKRLESELSTMDNRAKFKLSNSIWYNSSFPINQSFLNVNKEYYSAQSTSLDFSKAESFDLMDKWVSDATNGLVDGFSVERTSNLDFMIANALYFNGKWRIQFDPNDTKDTEFRNSDGTVSTVKMMLQKNCLYYEPKQENGKFVILEFPYGNWASSLFVAISVLESDLSLDGIENVIIPKNIEKIGSYALRTGGTTKLPRFEVSSNGDIVKGMKALGINELFGNNADLSGISNSKIGNLTLMQESVLKVDESGAEGGSVTALIPFTGLDFEAEEPKSFIVNSPFVFWIMEHSSNSIIFMGKVDKL